MSTGNEKKAGKKVAAKKELAADPQPSRAEYEKMIEELKNRALQLEKQLYMVQGENKALDQIIHESQQQGANRTIAARSPDHYSRCKIQPWDYILANGIPFMEGEMISYLTRWRDKGGIKDLEKVRHFVDKLIEWEVEQQRQAAIQQRESIDRFRRDQAFPDHPVWRIADEVKQQERQ